MQLRNCPICNARPSNAGLIGPLADHQKQEGRDFNLTYCACGDLVYLSPAPDESDIRAMYVDMPQFDSEEYRGDLVRAAADEFYYGRFRALLEKMNHPEDDALRVLEVGAGLSWMCRAAKRLNPRNLTVAQDISSEAAQECTWVDSYYVSADVMTCSEIEHQAPYDVISLTHVIEHLVDPVGALKRLRRVIAPGGLLFITAPHRPPGWKSGNGIELWRDWSYNHVPAHVQYFSRRSMERAAREAGLELVFWATAEEEQAFEAWLKPSTPAVSMVGAGVREQIALYRNEFANALPFPHVVIDNFFEADKAEQVLEEFPPFDPANAKNEFGEVGRKAVVTDIRKISPFYAEVYKYTSSEGFLDLISQITGIPDLVHDELMFGAGTHENLEGQALDPHVDFNFIESSKLHRRLNLLLYLNKEWEQEWGGCLELHSNPRRPRENRIDVIRPMFNRCVVFETSERSWHGFERIRLPEGKKHLSRKLLSIYLYTRDRPAEEIVAPHGTFYVQRPLPARFAPGHTLTAEDVADVQRRLQARDGWIEYYQRKEIADSGRIQRLLNPEESAGPGPQVRLSENARQRGRLRGMWQDSWIGSPFEITVALLAPIDFIVVRGYSHPHFQGGQELCVFVDDAPASRHRVPPGEFLLKTCVKRNAGETVKLRITSFDSYSAVRAGTGTDVREIVAVLEEILCLGDTAVAPEPPPTLHVPVVGCGRQEGPPAGFWPDGWIGNPFEVGIRLEEPIGSIVIEGYLPEEPPGEMELTIRVNGVAVLRQRPTKGLFALEVPADVCSLELVKLTIASDVSFHAGDGDDIRERVIVLREIRLCREAIDPHQGNAQVTERPGRLRTFVRNRILSSG